MANRPDDLVIWQRAMDLAQEIYRVSCGFPREEIYGLTAQVRRAAVSIPSNIAEGHGRLSANEFRHFLGLARGSLREVETQLLLAVRLAFLSEIDIAVARTAAGDLARMLNRFILKIAPDSADVPRSPLAPKGRRAARSPSATADV